MTTELTRDLTTVEDLFRSVGSSPEAEGALTRCPVCDCPLYLHSVERIIPARQVRNNWGILEKQEAKRVSISVYLCQDCGWAAQSNSQGNGPMLGKSEDPIPESCHYGHFHAWRGRRRGGRLDLRCAGLYKGQIPCPGSQSVWFKKQGFLNGNGRNPDGETKKVVYAALTYYRKVGGACLNQIVDATGLTPSQVSGCLKAGIKYHYVERTPEMVEIVPRGRGYLYALTERGEAWVRWAKGKGFYT